MSTHCQHVLAGTYEDDGYENHLLPFLWQKGESRETISDYLEKIAASDIHEICLESRPHPDFCGEGWWDDLAYIIGECKRLDLGIWLLDDAHFPTGYANGVLKNDHPELRKCVLTHRTLDVVGPAPRMSIALSNPFDATERFFGAAALQDGEPIEVAFETLTDAEGVPVRLVFDAPAGLTQVCLIFTSRQTGYRDEYINMVDKASCDVLIEAVYQPHYDHFADEFGTTILGFFSDEPGFMNEKGAVMEGAVSDTLIGKEDMALPWSDELERRLREELGESFMGELPGLWTREARGAHARHVYMDVATALYRECFTENIGGWCREHGVAYIGHVIEDKDNHARLGQGAGNYFRAVAGQDMAGVDIVINQLVPGMDTGLHSYGRGKWDMEFFDYALAKLGSSAAHLDPKKQGRCMAEVFGAFGWHEGLKEMKWIADHFLVRGVNWFVPHAFSQAEFPDPDCPPHFYAHGNNPQFRAFPKLMTYMNRMGTLLSGGSAHPVAAVLYHADAEWCGEAMPMQKVARELTRHQIDFDFVPEEAFSDAGRYAVTLDVEGASFSVNGQGYRCLVVPRMEFMGADTLAFISQAVGAGVPVIFVDGRPDKCYDGMDAAMKGFSPVSAAALSGTQVVELDELAAVLITQGLYDARIVDDEPWLRTYHYTKQGEEYWFLVNESPRETISTCIEGLSGARFDVLNGGAGAAFDGALELAPYESCLVVEGAEGAPAEKADSAQSVRGPWSVAFASSTAYPAFEEEHALDELADLSSTLYPDACGTFRYECAFQLDEDIPAGTLELGEAYETVDAWIDDEPLGTRIAPPYRYEVKGLTAGGHALRVEVTNTLDKAVTDMFVLTEPSEPSGLLGPVELRW